MAGIIGREDDGELRRHFQKLRHHFHAAVRDIRDRAIARQGARPKMNLSESAAHPTFASPAIYKHLDHPLLDHAPSRTPISSEHVLDCAEQNGSYSRLSQSLMSPSRFTSR
jgi:hypothetical protein